MGTSRGNHPNMLLNLVLLCAAGYAQAGLITYSNGAVVPVDYANQAATAAHLANKFAYGAHGAYGGAHYLDKRDAEADAGLVGYTNGAVVPYNPYLHGFGGHYGHYLGKREAEADAGLLSYAAVLPYHAVYQPLVAHPNGAVVPLEPAAVVAARADHLATKYGK